MLEDLWIKHREWVFEPLYYSSLDALIGALDTKIIRPAEYLARIEDLGCSDLVQVDCAACHDVALLTPDFLLRLGLSPRAKVMDLKSRVRCRGCAARGRAVVSVKWGREGG